jgi:YVTN family beta-propeller protein
VVVEDDGVVIDERRFPGRQGRLLFAYLVAEAGRAVPRGELADALWEAGPPSTWEKALSVLVSKLRVLLAQTGIDGARSLTGAFGCYRLELPEGSWVDVLAAASRADEAEEALAAGEMERAKAAAAVAESLARQPFLPGDDETWVEGKRRELAGVRARALTVLADASLRSEDGRDAAQWAEQAIALEPFRESGYRRLMQAHVAAGDRAEALRVYDRCRRLLAEELGAYPSPETESIYRGLLEAPPRPTRTTTAQAPLGGAGDQERAAIPTALDVGSPRRRQPGRGALIAGGALAAAALIVLVIAARPGRLTGGSGASPLSASVGANAVTAIDSSGGRTVGSARLEGPPSAIAYGEGSVWVTMPNEDSVSRIDPNTNSVQQTIGAGDGPTAIVVGGGFVWVASSLDGTVLQIDPQAHGGQVVDKIAVGNGPTGVAYGLGGVWVANSVDRTVERIDPLTDKPGTPISVDAGADAIAVADGAVWVASRSAGVLSRVDPTSGSVTPINVGNGPVAVAATSRAVWVANSQDATVWRVDPATDRVVATVTVGEGPSGLAVGSGGKSVWVSNELSGTVSRIDSATGKVVSTVAIGDQPQGVAASADHTYVAVKGSGGGAHRGGTLTLAVAVAPDLYQPGIVEALDPAVSGEQELLTMTNDGLLGYGRSGGAEGYRVVPDLAVALPGVSDGGRMYSFRLRPDIRYSTGALVRPADIRRGIERALLAGWLGANFAGIVGAAQCVAAPTRCDLTRGIVTDTKRNTIVIRLTHPDPDFLYKLALPTADAVPTSTPLKARLPLPATGPYEIAGIDSTREIVRLVRNPRFHLWSAAAQPDGFPDQIVERYGYTGESAVRAVERGTADITSDGIDQAWTPALASSLRTRYSSRLYTTPTMNITAVWLNTRLPPFDDLRVRRALNYAVDRNQLIALAGGPEVAQVGCQMLPPNVDGYRPYCPFTLHPNPAGTYQGADLAKARRLVAASGTKGQSVTAWFFDIPIGRRISAYFVSVLRSLGYNAHRRLLDRSDVTWRPNRQIGVAGIGPAYPSANNALAPWFTCRSYTPDPPTNNNDAEFCNRTIDAEVAYASTLQITDPPAASQLWGKIDRELTNLAPWIVIRDSIAADFLSRRTGNYTPCWQSFWNSTAGACLDQLWVR